MGTKNGKNKPKENINKNMEAPNPITCLPTPSREVIHKN